MATSHLREEPTVFELDAMMFSNGVLRVEVLALELYERTEKWAEGMRRTKNITEDRSNDLVNQRQEILDCGIRLIQCIEDNSSSAEHLVTEDKDISLQGLRSQSAETEAPLSPSSVSSGREDVIQVSGNSLSPPNSPKVFSDSGIDVTAEDKDKELFTMNGVTAGHTNCGPTDSITILRDTLRNLKQATDKAVVRFLVRAREVLREKVKSKNDIDRDEKLLGLISDLLGNKHEAEKQLKDISCSYEEGSPLGLLEKSLCYILVDKALLNCILTLDKVLMEGKLPDQELNSQLNTGHKLFSEFGQALNEKREFVKLSEELRRKEKVVDTMRNQIRELSSEKLKLENDNKGLVEKSRSWKLKSEDLEMRNAVIDSDRERLKEKVLFLEESTTGLESSMEHLRHQLQTLEHKDDASRYENELLKGKLQAYSEEMKRGVENGPTRKQTGVKDLLTNYCGDSKTMVDRLETLLSDNQDFRKKIESLETDDYERRENMTALTRAHQKTMQQKNEEIRVLMQQNGKLMDDLDTRSAEIALLKEQTVELQKRVGKGLNKFDEQDGYAENILPLNGVFVDRDLQQIKELSYRAKSSENRVEEYSTLLDELAKRKEILVNKLEMVGAVTVIKNDFDVPDGYTEAIDSVLRSQSSLIEKGVLSILSERDQTASERKALDDENKRLKFTAEALETENLLLQIQVSDLTKTVEELEDDVFYMKCGRTQGKIKLPDTPGSNSVHRVTFDDESDTKRDENLECLIQNAKERCKNLEKQIRRNTSLLKTTQYENQNLLKDHEDLRRENCNLRQYLEEGQRTNKLLHVKISELEERLQCVDDEQSLNEMEKQSLLDRLKIFEGQIKFLKLEKERMRSRLECLKMESNSSDEMHRSLYSKFLLLEEIDNGECSKKDSVDELERLKNKVKKQSARSRVWSSEVFEFLDDIRCLESELSSVIDGFYMVDKPITPLDDGMVNGGIRNNSSSQGGQTKEDGIFLGDEGNNHNFALSKTDTVANTWGVEASLCQQNGMAPIMGEVVKLLKSTVKRLQRIAKSTSSPSESSVWAGDVRHDSNDRQNVLRSQIFDEISDLRKEKHVLQREVLALKDIAENMFELQSHSPEDVYKANEKDRTRSLQKQVLDSVQRNSELEGEIMDCLTQKWVLESELDYLKECILNLKDEGNTLLALSDATYPCSGHTWRKSCEKGMVHFCFVKNDANEFEAHDGLKIESCFDEDVFSCPSDEGVCPSPDREASSCDSGYNSSKYEEGHKVALNEEGDSGLQSRYQTCHTSIRPALNTSYYDNTVSTERNTTESSLAGGTADTKPKGILKKVNHECGNLKTQKMP